MSAAYRAGWERIFGSVVRAEVVESFRYLACNRLRGCVFYRGQDRLPGMVVIDLDDVHASIKKEYAYYSTSYVRVGGSTGPWAEVEFDEFEQALLECCAEM